MVIVCHVTKGHAIQRLVQRQLLQRTRRCQASKCASTPGGCSECLARPAKRCTRSAELGAEIALSKPERLPRLLVSLATEWLDISTTDARDSGPKVRLQPCLLDSDVTDCDMPQPKKDRLQDGLLLLQMFYEGPCHAPVNKSGRVSANSFGRMRRQNFCSLCFAFDACHATAGARKRLCCCIRDC